MFVFDARGVGGLGAPFLLTAASRELPATSFLRSRVSVRGEV
jgi:hypothetical protein